MHSITYAQLSKSQKKKLCNGAGRAGIWGRLIPDFVFKEAANEHDFDYWHGCTKNDRFTADRKFLANMLDAAERKKNGKRRFVLFRMFYRNMALKYYSAVREFGGTKNLGGFHFATRERSKEDLIKQFDIESRPYVWINKKRNHN